MVQLLHVQNKEFTSSNSKRTCACFSKINSNNSDNLRFKIQIFENLVTSEWKGKVSLMRFLPSLDFSRGTKNFACQIQGGRRLENVLIYDDK